MSLIKVFRPLLIFFLATFMLFVFVATASAHGVGQPSFFKVNGKFVGYNTFYYSSSFFEVPQDKPPENYLVNQELKFEIDVIPLQISSDDLKQTTFYWDFGDGSTALGLKNTHNYTTPGSYVVNITSSYGGGQPQLFESVLVQVLPFKGYQLPKAVILVNGQQESYIQVPFSQPVLFDATKSMASSKIVAYTWDFSSQSSSDQPVCQYKFASNSYQRGYVLLRVKDEQGFFSDASVYINDKDANNQAVPPPPRDVQNNTPDIGSQQSSIPNHPNMTRMPITAALARVCNW